MNAPPPSRVDVWLRQPASVEWDRESDQWTVTLSWCDEREQFRVEVTIVLCKCCVPTDIRFRYCLSGADYKPTTSEVKDAWDQALDAIDRYERSIEPAEGWREDGAA